MTKGTREFESWQDTGICAVAVVKGDSVELAILDGMRVGGKFPYAPVIATVVSETVRRGDYILISGKGFGPVQEESVALIGGLKMTIEKWTEILIKARIPLNAKTGKITVVTKDGSATSASPVKVIAD